MSDFSELDLFALEQYIDSYRSCSGQGPVTSTPSSTTIKAMQSESNKQAESTAHQQPSIMVESGASGKVLTPIKSHSEKKRKADESLNITKDDMEIMLTGLREDLSLKMDDLKSEMITAKQENQAKLKELNASVNEMKTSLTSQMEETSTLREENKQLREEASIMQGRMIRTEKIVSDLREDILEIQARSMRNNLVFYKIDEHQGEDLSRVLNNFLSNTMKMNSKCLEQIRLERIHRLGQPKGQSRPIIAEMNPVGVSLVLQHAKNLSGTPYGVNIQLPPELAERRKRLLPRFKEARQSNSKVAWGGNGAKLFVNNVEHKIKKDAVLDINQNTTEKALSMQVTRAPPKLQDHNCFQGCKVGVSSRDDVIPGLHAIYRDHRVARATHNIYAYRLVSGDRVMEHYEDDGETGGGAQILKVLKDSKMENILLCVSRWCGGKNLGPARFTHIAEAAKTALQL